MGFASINGKSLVYWSAELLDNYSVGATEHLNGYIKPYDKTFPVILRGKFGLRPISMTMDFSGSIERDVALRISNLTEEVMKQVSDIALPDDYHYLVALESVSTPKKVAPWLWQVTFNFRGVRVGSKLTISRTSSVGIYAQGNMPSPMTVKLVPTSGATSMGFNDITVSLGRTVTIDGMETTVKDLEGLNVFGYTNLTEWPKLVPGNNPIELTNCTAEISYYPVFL